MNRIVAAAFGLVAFAVCVACERSPRQEDRDNDDQGRTGDTPPPRVENPSPTLAPNATSNDPKTVGARDTVALEDQRRADADFKAGKGQKLQGDAELHEVPNGVRVVVDVADAPAGMKGIYIYEKGDCSDVERASMGKHFAPKGEKHGSPASPEHHLGDLGNIEIDKQGKGKLDIVVAGANLKEKDPLSLLSKAIVIHAGKDTDAQPSGGAGKAIACAVIEKD